MTETSLKDREAVRPDLASLSEAQKGRVEHAVQQIVEADPERARQLLAALRDGDATPARHFVLDTLKALGLLSGVLNEAMRPTPLQMQPARLVDAWAAVGGYIQHGLRKLDERIEHRG